MSLQTVETPANAVPGQIATKTAIPFFEALFEVQPEYGRLIPRRFTRQPVSRPVFRKGHRRHHVGRFPSRRNGTMVPFESTLEKQACTLFESYPEINAYRSQPYPVRVFFEGRNREVYPDFELVFSDQKVLVDIRFEQGTLSDRFQARMAALDLYTAARGMRYVVLTERAIRTSRLEASSRLLSWCHVEPLPALIDAVIEWLQTNPATTIGGLLHTTTAYPAVSTVIAGLLLDGYFELNWDKPLYGQVYSLRG